MSLRDEIKQHMFAAMKAGRVVEKEVLRVVLGEVTTSEARGGAELSDVEVQAVVRKLVKSNEETLALAEDAEARVKLEQELAALRALLPRTLGVDEIMAALEGVAESIRNAKNDGQGTGIAMKALKAAGASVEGKEVAQAVARLRSAPSPA